MFLYNSQNSCHKINQFNQIEEINDNFIELVQFLKDIRFRYYGNKNNKNLFCLLKTKPFKYLSLNDIIVPSEIRILSSNKRFLKIQSLNVSLKILLEVKF